MTFTATTLALQDKEVVVQAKAVHSSFPSHKEKRGQKYNLASAIPDPHSLWILHERETYVKTPPKLSFSQHLERSSCGCETSEFVLSI